MSAQRPGVKVNGRVAQGQRRFTDKVDRRVTGVVHPDLPWDQREMTPEQARPAGVISLREFSVLKGYSPGSMSTWRYTKPDFPEPVCFIRCQPPSHSKSIGYLASDLEAWFIKAVRNRWVYPPRTNDSVS